MDSLRFTFTEVLSLFGVFQCVYVIVHICFRARRFANAFLPCLYFLILGVAFFTDVAERFLSEGFQDYASLQWFFWTLGIPVSVLLIIQISQTARLPSLMFWFLPLLVPLAYFTSVFLIGFIDENCTEGNCREFYTLLSLSGSFVGAVSLLLIWFKRTIFEDIQKQKAGQERYWLILSFITINIAYLGVGIFGSGLVGPVQFSLFRTVIGLGFVYLISTSLFRIYPSAFIVTQEKTAYASTLSDEELKVAQQIVTLLERDKIYHEVSYSRSDLAKELGVPDGAVSRIINLHFNKSFPQLLNEYRIEDSKRLLLGTQETIKVVAEEVGFNSLASYNRAFKSIVGQSPSAYRKNMIN